jgi:hypothetical protein
MLSSELASLEHLGVPVWSCTILMVLSLMEIAIATDSHATVTHPPTCHGMYCMF